MSMFGESRLDRRISVFRRGIEVVDIKRDVDELITLAGHRLDLTQRGGLPLDRLLFNLADSLAAESALDWKLLALRMPNRSPIYEACMRRSRGEPLCPELVAMGWSEPV